MIISASAPVSTASTRDFASTLRFFRAAGYELLAVTADPAAAVALPALHRDPFERMVVAQALHEPLRLMTHDPIVAAYSDSILLF